MARLVRSVFLSLMLLMAALPAFAEGRKSTAIEELTVVSELLAQDDPVADPIDEAVVDSVAAIEITGIQIEETETGFTLLLETSGELPAPDVAIQGNAVVANSSNAVLSLPEDEDFLASNPANGIALVSVSALPNNHVQIAITGADAPPVADFQASALGLMVSVGVGETISQSSDDDAIQLTVTGEQTDDDYFVPNSNTATRTDTPLRDVPQSIQVIPRQIIEDQQATGLEDILENAAGVTFQGNNDGRGLNFAVRGFDNVPVLRDGFNLSTFGIAAEPELANLERVEVLRGPASLYGQSEPGGVVNLVTKQPLSEPYYNFKLQAGNREFLSPCIVLSGPLTEDGRRLSRLNALYRQEDSFRDYDNSFNRFSIAPTFSGSINEQTDLSVNLEYIRDDDPYVVGTLAFEDGIADVPLERVFNNPDSTVEQDYLNVGYTLEHRFNDDWQLRNQFRYIASNFEYSVFPRLLSLDESTGILNRTFSSQSNESDTYAFYTNVQGKFNTGSVEHTLLFGVDLALEESEGESRASRDPAFLSPIDIFDPNYSAVPTPSRESIPIFAPISNETRTNQLGVYLQNQADILDNLILVAGLRYDTVNQTTTNVATDETTDQYDDALTPRIGIVYQPIEPISLYANYSRSFVPNGSTDAEGEPLEAEEGEGFEVGVRADIIENRLAATLAYFNITKQNVATADPVVPFTSVATGEQRSQGIDFNVTGEVLPGWNIVASYAYTDAKVTNDNTDIVGNRLSNIPEHSASLWTAYEIQSGNLQGLGFGLGINFVGERQGDLANSFQTDSYFLTHAAISYQRSNWQARLNIDNLFDTDYIESTNNSRLNQIYPGDPLTVRASISYTF